MLTQELEKVRIEKGVLSSYVSELEDKLKLIEGMTPVELSIWKFEQKTDKEFTQLESRLKNLKQELQKANTEKNLWRNKYCGLLPKTESKSQ